MRNIQRFREAIFVMLVAMVLVAPLTDYFLGIAPELEFRENRTLANPPEFHDKIRFRRFLLQFEDYFNDNFGFRKLLVYSYSWLQYHIFARGEGVLVGNQDWLFLEKGVRSDLDSPIPVVFDLCGETPFSEDEVKRWTQGLVQNWRALQRRNIQYLYIPVPNKHTIYQDRLPSYGQCGKQHTRLDQLVDQLKAYPEFPILDLRSIYLEKKPEVVSLYLKNDTHWNDTGILYAYDSIIDRLNGRVDFENASNRAKLVAGTSKGGDLALMLGLQDNKRYPELNLAIQRLSVRQDLKPYLDYLPKNLKHRFDAWRHPNQNLDSVLLFHDSFGVSNIAVLLAESFAESFFIQQSPITLDMEIIDQLEPDIVLHEMVERGLILPKSR